MGTKRALSPIISKMVGDCRPGPFLDAFAGMCSIGSTVGPARQVWSNDLQVFSNTVAKALFCSIERPRICVRTGQRLRYHFERNMRILEERFGSEKYREIVALNANDHGALQDIFEGRIVRTEYPKADPTQLHDLFTARYAGVYFSTKQAMEIDCWRAAIDHTTLEEELSEDQGRWLLLAAAIGMNRCTTSPGHFAQPVAPKQSNINRIVRERSKSLFNESVRNFRRLQPIGTEDWRARNRVYSTDAGSLLSELGEPSPGVVYADPPYTDDQYSRFYHLYETLILYDFPTCSGRGRYRAGRAVSDFSLASKVEGALEKLIKSAAELPADLILSYPANGLLEKSEQQIPALIQAHYGRSPTVISIDHTHSTMGASKGGATTQVLEKVYKIAA